MIRKLFAALLVLMVIAGCKQADKKTAPVTHNTTIATPFIQRPIDSVDIPYQEWKVNSAAGDTLFYHTGSILVFPPNAFIDKIGHIVTGEVVVKYREFTDPLDFYLSGIPMQYDSAGTGYTLSSSGMCEILAFKDGKPVYVNPAGKPEIHLATSDSASNHNVYFLDTVQRKWIYQEVSQVTVLNDLSKTADTVPATETPSWEETVEPVKPEKANSKSPVMKIVVDPASFKELSAYDNLRFQLEPDGRPFTAQDTSEEWNKIELLKTSTRGVYIVRFSNTTKTVEYRARPVFEGKDYDKALAVFEGNRKVYAAAVKERMKHIQKTQTRLRKQARRDSLETVRFSKYNKLVEARNRSIVKRNAEIMVRSFKINGFGIYNSDVPRNLPCARIQPVFRDVDGNDLVLTNVAVLVRTASSTIDCPDIVYVPVRHEVMIAGLCNGLFAYMAYDDVRRLNITESTKELVFTMTVVPKEFNNSDYIRSVIRLTK